MDKETTETTEVVNEWMDKVNADAQAKADEISTILGKKVTPFVFVIEGDKDAAVGFISEPDAEQGFKILRALGTNYEGGVKLIAQAQLVRDADLKARGFDGTGSDARFMDASGKYSPENSMINLSLLMKCSTSFKPFTDQFKKK